MNIKEITNKVIVVTKEVGTYLKGEQNKITSEKIEKKGRNDFVTYVDKTAEQKIVNKLKVILPEAGFIAEEGTETKQAEEYNWIIDPLDGTTNFIHGLKPFSISIALQKKKEIIIGVVFEVGLNECFYAYRNGGAFLNGEPISVSKTDNLSESLIATGFPYYDYRRLPNFMKSLQYFIENTHGVRRFGTAATDLAYVACGRFEAYYEYGLQSWDVAAGSLIVKEAGGKVSDFLGGNNYIFGKEIIVGNYNVFDSFFVKIDSFYNKECRKTH